MSRYLRNRDGCIYFFTVVSEQRRPILTTDLARRALRQAIQEVRHEQPFQIIGFVLLPDHIHTIWELPPDDIDYSIRWKKIKTCFTKTWRKSGGTLPERSYSRIKRGEQSLWQRRFFEHTCQDESDRKRCLDYLHVNPLKHGLVDRVKDWRWSSFHRYMKLREYNLEWGNSADWYGDEFQYFE